MITSVVVAQDAQPGVPALLETVNGKKAGVLLQRIDETTLTFRAGKSTKDMAAPCDKIKSLKFAMSKEEFDLFREQNILEESVITEIYSTPDVSKSEKLALIFQAVLDEIENDSVEGEVDSVVAILEPIMEARAPYMSIQNNLQALYVTLMESYLKQNNYSKMRECAAVLSRSTDLLMVLKAKTNMALAALAENDIPAAQALTAEVDSEVVSIYLQACIDRVNGEYKKAHKAVAGLILKYGNDQNWLPATELLSAHLYLNEKATNSAVYTARQVMNIYNGTAISADARQFRAELGFTGDEDPVLVEEEPEMEEEAPEVEVEPESTMEESELTTEEPELTTEESELTTEDDNHE